MPTPLLAAVLILNPDPAVAGQLADALRPQFTVSIAWTIAEAAQIVVTRRPVVILCEWDLPDGDGLEFIRQLRAESSFAAMAIACVSRIATIKAKVQAFQAGADDYVVLPIDPNSFVYRIILLRRLRRLTG